MADQPEQEEGSIILEEENPENYQPSEQETLEYAKYLGMDLENDADLLYIAVEGLKAPLPSPWKACQTKDGQIYYVNFETEQSRWDHPLDDYYREFYLREKAKKNMSGNQKKQPTQTQGPGTGKNLDLSPEAGTQGGNTKSKDLSNILETLHEQSRDSASKNEEDRHKKLQEYRGMKEKEYSQKIQEIDDNYQAKLKEIDFEYSLNIQSLCAEMENKLRKEEEAYHQQKLKEKELLKQENQKRLETLKSNLKEEFEKKNEEELKRIRQEYEEKLRVKREALESEKDRELKTHQDNLQKAHEAEIAHLKREVQALKEELEHKEKNYDAESPSKKISELERAKEKFIREQEEEFEREKEKIIERYKTSLEDLKAKERANFDAELKMIQRVGENERKSRLKNEEQTYRMQMEKEYLAKLEDFKRELARQKEEKKAEVDAKLEEYKARRREELEKKALEEFENINAQWQKEKAAKDEQFNLDKTLIESEMAQELQKYRDQFNRKMNERLRQLEKEKFERTQELERVNNELSKLAGNTDWITPQTSLQDIKNGIQTRLQKMNEDLHKKNLEIKELSSKKFQLNGELTQLMAKVEGAKQELAKMQGETTLESLNTLKQHLTRKLEEKENELRTIQSEKSTIGPNLHESVVGSAKKFSANESMTIDTEFPTKTPDMQRYSRELPNTRGQLRKEGRPSRVDLQNQEFKVNPEKDDNRRSQLPFQKSEEVFSTQNAGIEKQMKLEIQNLMNEKNQILADIASFDKEFSASDIQNEMKSYYVGIKTMLENKLIQVDKKLQNLNKFMGWVKKVGDTKHGDVSNPAFALNKTFDVDYDSGF